MEDLGVLEELILVMVGVMEVVEEVAQLGHLAVAAAAVLAVMLELVVKAEILALVHVLGLKAEGVEVVVAPLLMVEAVAAE